MSNSILLIGDTVSACRVALSAMEPVLTKCGYNVSTLPTAIVSNTFGYKKTAQVSTGDYVNKSLRVWEEMSFDFDAVYVGYITDPLQAAAVTDFCKKKSRRGKTVFLDTIMGEDFHLYYGMGEETAEIYRKILSYADYIMPSWTEAAFLAGYDHTKRPSDRQEVYKVAEKLRKMGVKNIVITSCLVDGGDYCVAFNEKTGEYGFHLCDCIPVKVAGTGDLFAAFFMADILSQKDINTAVRNAMDKVRRLVLKNKDNPDTMRGVRAEDLL